MSELNIEVGLNIRNARKSKGISQENLALRAKIDRSYMSRVERGLTNLTIESLYKIAGAIGVSPHSLLP
jgi:transcriptional regulator with XRE-family HTH domain